MTSDPSLPMPNSEGHGATIQIVGTSFLTFLCYLTIGLPLAVLPTYVQARLGYGPVLAGLTISVQYLATLLSRPQAGRMSDAVGPKQTVLCGLVASGASGLCLLAADAVSGAPLLGLAGLLVSRLVLGFGESWVGTGAIAWGIGRVGPEHTARMISWNGIASYGALALGAPLGVAIDHAFGFAPLGLLIIGSALLGFALAWGKPRIEVVAGRRMGFGRVFRRVLPYGIGLGLGSIGFGTIATFITLFYASRGWANAAYALAGFGLAFIGVRLVFAGAIDRFGGYSVSVACFAVEAVGLLLLWAAPGPAMALAGAALAGAGFSLVFPGLGVEGVTILPAANRGAALGAYTVFLDLSLGVTGPAVGVIASRFGYADAFLFAAAAAAAGLVLTLVLRADARHPA